MEVSKFDSIGSNRRFMAIVIFIKLLKFLEKEE